MNEGEYWFVKLPGEVQLFRCEIRYLGSAVATLFVIQRAVSQTFKISDVEFVEKFIK